MDKKIENYWRTLQMVNEWIRFSDTKSGIIVTLIGVIYTIIYSNSNEIYQYLISSNLSIGISLMGIILSIISGFYAFKCLNPRLKNPNPKSMIYFGHIATHNSYKKYLDFSISILNDDQKIIEQLAEQVYVNSTISWNKFRNVSISIRFFFASLGCLILLILTYYLKM